MVTDLLVAHEAILCGLANAGLVVYLPEAKGIFVLVND